MITITWAASSELKIYNREITELQIIIFMIWLAQTLAQTGLVRVITCPCYHGYTLHRDNQRCVSVPLLPADWSYAISQFIARQWVSILPQLSSPALLLLFAKVSGAVDSATECSPRGGMSETRQCSHRDTLHFNAYMQVWWQTSPAGIIRYMTHSG